MSQLQKFLYTHASKPLVDKEKKVNLIPKEEADPNVRRQPICVNRFAGFSKQSDIHIEDYSSCIYCDVEPEAFWEFLYSDEWKDSVILRVFSGELYDNMDLKLNEMLRDDKISRHVTCAYLKMNTKTNNMKFNLAPETVRIEFTYYGKNLERRPLSSATTFTPTDSLSQTLKSSSPNSEPSSSIDLLTDYNKKLVRKLSRSLGESIQSSKMDGKGLTEKNMININLAHFYCSDSLDIKESIESECDALEIKLKGILGMGKESIGSWESMSNEKRIRRVRKMRKRFKSVKNRDNDDDDDDDDDDEDDDEDDTEDEDEKKKKEIEEEKRKQKLRKQIEKGMLKKRKKLQLGSALFESQEPLMSIISADIQLKTMGKILEGEKYLKFNKMTTKTRKKFFLTDERIARTNRKLMKMKSGRSDKNKRAQLLAELHRGRTQVLFKRISSIPDLYEFALMVFGVTDSYEIFRTILWMSKGSNYQMKRWRQWYEKYFKKKDKKSLQNKRASQEMDATLLRKRSKDIDSSIGDEVDGIESVRSGDNRISARQPVQKISVVSKNRKDREIRKVGSQKRRSGDNTRKEGHGDSRGEKLEKITKRLELALQKQQNEQEEEEEVEEEEDEEEEKGEKEEEESDTEIEEIELENKKYHWEINGDEFPVRSKTEIVIPNFKQCKKMIRSEMIIKAMNDFIIRKERITSTNEFSFMSLAFIRPSFAHKLFK